MEFNFNINNLFGNEICLIDKDLTPYRTSPLNIREYKAQLCQVIDKMGEASAKAQGLHGAITTAHRLQLTDHRLYIMKDGTANGGKGAIIGFIKMGHKRLFIYDHNGVNHEMEPLCTLDFYVHESRQRMGCGRKLFEFMLKAEGVQPHQLAIDRPSHKFLAFLNKHYKLKTIVPQVNNFVVFESFFRSGGSGSNIDKRKGNPYKPPVPPYRKTNSQELNGDGTKTRLSDLPSRPMSGNILPLSREKMSEHEMTESVQLPQIDLTINSAQPSPAHTTNCTTICTTAYNTACTSNTSVYVSHNQVSDTPQRLASFEKPRVHSAPLTRDYNLMAAPSSNSLVNSQTGCYPFAMSSPPNDSTFPSTHPLRHVSSTNILAWDVEEASSLSWNTRQKEALSNVPLQRQHSTENTRNIDRHQNAVTGQLIGSLAMGAQSAKYSRHGSTPPTPSSQHGQRDNNILPPHSNGVNNTTDNVRLDVSKRIIGGRDPPLRHRDGPSDDYRRLFTTDSYQDRHGHLRVAPLAETEVNSYKQNGFNYQKSKSSPTVVMATGNNTLSDGETLKSQALGSGWNVFGIPPNPRSVNYAKYHQTKLW